MSTEVILKIENLTKHFGGITAVDGVDLEVKRGDLVGVIGPNGSGKTTLVNLISGFQKPDKGRVTFNGKNITGKQPYTIANLGIARTFQMVKAFSHIPTMKNLIIPLYSPRVKKLVGGRYGERDHVAIDLLEDVGFERDSSIPYKAAGSLPHGYLKRMELARCMALRPEILILDELFSGMSMSEVASTLPIIERLIEEGKTMIVIEHRLKELFRIANRVIVLNFGQKIADGSPKQVMETDSVKEAYLGSEVEKGA
jgi:ABC-type branched-subunit amino acid transport system ATPase component